MSVSKEQTFDVSDIEQLCKQHKLRLTDARKLIAKVISNANDHPDVEEIYKRVNAVDKKISLATVYRTLKLFSDAGVVDRHDFQDGRARYEPVGEEHDHIINIKTGDVIEFTDHSIINKLKLLVEKEGFELVEHKLELYVIPKK